MSPPENGTLTLNDPQAEEDRMRAALGLAPEHAQSNRPAEQSRHRAGQGSGASVTVVNTCRPSEASDTLRARLTTLENALRAERGERVAAQQALADAQRTIQQLQTKLAHTEMAAAEALGIEHKARLDAEARLLTVPPMTAPELTAETPAEPKKRGRPPQMRQVAEKAEPEPVQWWLSSYKAANAKRTRSRS